MRGLGLYFGIFAAVSSAACGGTSHDESGIGGVGAAGGSNTVGANSGAGGSGVTGSAGATGSDGGSGATSSGGATSGGGAARAGECFPSDVRDCGSSMGACKLGVQTCSAAGHWTSCVNQVDPKPEVCDDIDNDCNGQVDDGLSAQCPAGCQAGVCRQCTAGQAMCLTANSAGVCLPPTVTQTVRLAAATSAATTARAIASTASASSAITILARRRRLRSDSMPRRQSRAIAAVRDVRGEVLHCQVRRGLGWRRRPAPVTERAEPSSCSHDEDPWSAHRRRSDATTLA